MSYYSVLYPAVAALDPNEPRARAAVYNRARKIVVDSAIDSTAGNARLSNELLALEKAIQQIEKEFLKKESAALDEWEPARPGSLRSWFWPPRPDNILRPRWGWLWKAAAAVSVVAALAIAGESAFSYWMKNKSRTAVDRATLVEAAETKLGQPDGGTDKRPYTLRRQLVYYRTTYPPGALIIAKSQKFLYLVRPNVAALRYSISISRKCADSAGLYQISEKEEFPGWDAPPPSGQNDLITRTANPLGARAL